MLYKIGDFSRLSRVTVRALRYYDEIGLLKPVKVDQSTGYRYYSIEQLTRLNRIAMLKDIGLSLDNICQLSRNDSSVDYIRQLLQVKKTEIQQRLNLDTRRLRQVDGWLDQVDKEGIVLPVSYIQRISVPEVRVISKREFGTYQETTDKLYHELTRQLNRQANEKTVRITGPLMGIFNDDEYKEENADIEIAFPISGEVPDIEPGFEVKTLSPIEVVATIYKGPSYNMHRVYARIMEYAEEHGLELYAPLRELYHTYPEETQEDGLLVEIQFPCREIPE
jgi:effector-binding domain-containing protein